MRALAFAAGLREAGCVAILAARAYDGRIADLVTASGHRIAELPLKLTCAEDLDHTQRIAAEHGAGLIVTDLCHYAALADRPALDAYHQALREDHFVVCISGGRALDIPADILVSPYVGAPAAHHLPDDGQMRLLGPDYFIFRPEFTAAARCEREIRPAARRILVAIGGGDDLRLTARVARALIGMAEPDLEMRIVFGAAYPHDLRGEVSDVLAGHKGQATFLTHGTDIAQQMLWADLLVMGDGLIKYEAAVTGTPGIMLSRPESDASVNAGFVGAGTLVHAGDGTRLTPGTLADMIGALRADIASRREMSRRGRELVDGRGLERILEAIPSEVLS
jgi:spore coat polysaccharide biosynthesis predicted glycosyltransferase SpsG